jgi:hypothetical protein
MTDLYAEYSTDALKITLDNVFDINRPQTGYEKKDG